MTLNFWPSYVIANEGCYYWGWFPAAELQIFLFLPWIVLAVHKAKQGWLRWLLISTGVLAGVCINFWIIWANNMAAGLFAPQDVLIFKIFVNKPYTKLHCIFLGIATAYIYRSINDYKQRDVLQT